MSGVNFHMYPHQVHTLTEIVGALTAHSKSTTTTGSSGGGSSGRAIQYQIGAGAAAGGRKEVRFSGYNELESRLQESIMMQSRSGKNDDVDAVNNNVPSPSSSNNRNPFTGPKHPLRTPQEEAACRNYFAAYTFLKNRKYSDVRLNLGSLHLLSQLSLSSCISCIDIEESFQDANGCPFRELCGSSFPSSTNIPFNLFRILIAAALK